MRIAIDARELAGQPTGVGRYLAEIVAAWNELPGAASHQFILCAPVKVESPPAANLQLSTATAPGDGTLWEQLALPRLLKQVGADVLFAPGYTGPVVSRVPMVVTIHDVSFAAHPEWFSWREGLRRRRITRLAGHRAARVITDSDFSKREIIARLRIDHSRIEVIYPGATALGSGSGTRASRAGGSPSDSLLLYVGSIFNRRHVPELIEGFSRLARRQTDLRLEIVGDNRTLPKIDVGRIVDASDIRDRIRIRSYVSQPELAELYSQASAFAFLSEYEGFGMTPLDALAAGIPIVVLDTEVAREVYGPAALYVPRPEPDLIEEALERVLTDANERARLHEAAHIVLERYSWRDCAQRILQVLVMVGTRRTQRT
ncbi:MAG: glycosyltransferase family 4 protein [Vicinamibacterales bacterium]